MIDRLKKWICYLLLSAKLDPGTAHFTFDVFEGSIFAHVSGKNSQKICAIQLDHGTVTIQLNRLNGRRCDGLLCEWSACGHSVQQDSRGVLFQSLKKNVLSTSLALKFEVQIIKYDIFH